MYSYPVGATRGCGKQARYRVCNRVGVSTDADPESVCRLQCRHNPNFSLPKTGILGGNSQLTERGKAFAHRLAEYMAAERKRNLHVWTSSLQRTKDTGRHIDAPKEEWKCLDEISAGVCEELTYERIAASYPTEFALRDADKYHYRYPKGESYEDLVARLEPVIIELERQRDVLVVGHQAVLRCLLGYFRQRQPDELPYERIPLHTVFKLTPRVDGCQVEEYHIAKDIGASDTHRSRPLECDPNRSLDEALSTTPALPDTGSGAAPPLAVFSFGGGDDAEAPSVVG